MRTPGGNRPLDVSRLCLNRHPRRVSSDRPGSNHRDQRCRPIETGTAWCSESQDSVKEDLLPDSVTCTVQRAIYCTCDCFSFFFVN